MERQTLPDGTELEYWRSRAADLWADKALIEAYLNVLEAENAQLRAENTAFCAQVQDLQGRIEALKARVLKLTQQIYGRKSEQQPQPQPPKSTGSGESDPQKPRGRGQQRGAEGHGRRNYDELPARVETHDVPEGSKSCPACGLPYDAFPPGEETSTEIEWRVVVQRVMHKRLSYHKTCQCPGTPTIITAPPPPKVIPKGLFTAEFIARLIIEKYALCRPLNRIGSGLLMEGLDLAQGTLVGVFQQVAPLLIPLYEAFHAHCVAAGVWQADETSWKVFEEVEGKTSHRWWLWAFACSDAVVFVTDPSRSAAVPKAFFGLTEDDPNPVPGLLGSDFYKVYQALREWGILSFYCWAHMRRHFLDAARGYPQLKGWAEDWRKRIATLYRLYNARKARTPGTQDYADADDQLRRFVQDEIEATWRVQLADRTIHFAGRDVLGTMERHWEGLTRFLDNPLLPLDNNEMERVLRTAVCCRKNFYGSVSKWSGEFAAMAWTITATVAKAKLNPLVYLVDFLTACALNGGKPLQGEALDRFLPWMMREEHKKAWAIPRSP